MFRHLEPYESLIFQLFMLHFYVTLHYDEWIFEMVDNQKSVNIPPARIVLITSTRHLT